MKVLIDNSGLIVSFGGLFLIAVAGMIYDRWYRKQKALDDADEARARQSQA